MTRYSSALTHQPPRARFAIRAIATVVLLEALRGRMVWLMLALLLGGFALAQYTAQIAITESVQIASGVFASWLRTASVFVDLKTLIGLNGRTDEQEQAELGVTEHDIIMWIRDTAIPEYEDIDDAFRKDQVLWIRTM